MALTSFHLEGNLNEALLAGVEERIETTPGVRACAISAKTARSSTTKKWLAKKNYHGEINDKFEATVSDEYKTALRRANLIDQICAGAGGPCAYKGKSKKEAHAGMGITEVELMVLSPI